jgi:hypothetical protein
MPTKAINIISLPPKGTTPKRSFNPRGFRKELFEEGNEYDPCQNQFLENESHTYLQYPSKDVSKYDQLLDSKQIDDTLLNKPNGIAIKKHYGFYGYGCLSLCSRLLFFLV